MSHVIYETTRRVVRVTACFYDRVVDKFATDHMFRLISFHTLRQNENVKVTVWRVARAKTAIVLDLSACLALLLNTLCCGNETKYSLDCACGFVYIISVFSCC